MIPIIIGLVAILITFALTDMDTNSFVGWLLFLALMGFLFR